jgi:hypothetical protein
MQPRDSAQHQQHCPTAVAQAPSFLITTCTYLDHVLQDLIIEVVKLTFPFCGPCLQVFNLKFMAKTLNRSAVKCEKEEKAERLKVKKAIEKGNVEGAKIYAQNAIRKKHEQLNYLRLASRLDAVVSRLDTQAKMQMVNKNMMAITKNLEKALASNNLEKVCAASCCSCHLHS